MARSEGRICQRKGILPPVPTSSRIELDPEFVAAALEGATMMWPRHSTALRTRQSVHLSAACREEDYTIRRMV